VAAVLGNSSYYWRNSVGIGKVLRRQRKAVGLTQEALGLDAQLERNFVSLLELGQRQPSLGTIFKMAGPLRLTPHEIVKLVEDELSAAAGSACRDSTLRGS